ncbi:hypothetical protein RCCS2_00537 [Roseobacter sp. CCS2]|nr:hypothetical protein RCCS2_00537 [Roseobacter sp. CCS2]
MVKDAVAGVAIADKSEDLNTFLQPACAAAIWRRQPAPAFQTRIDTLDPLLLPQGRIILRPEAVPLAVNALCDTAQTPACA